MGGKDTRTRIIKGAVKLFNRSGTGDVSTNHIAKAMKISPGNLYYHFGNKDAIIRAIFEQMISEMNTAWRLPTDRPPSLLDLRTMLTKINLLMWNYRFFQRELVVLMHRDPKLRRRYRAIRQQRWSEMDTFFRSLMDQKVLREPEDPATMPALLRVGWLISEHWLSFLDIEGRAVDPKSVEEGMQLMLHVMRPYLSEKALAELGQSADTAQKVAT